MLINMKPTIVDIDLHSRLDDLGFYENVHHSHDFVLKWLREERSLHISIGLNLHGDDPKTYWSTMEHMLEGSVMDLDNNNSTDYESAVDVAVLTAIKYLEGVIDLRLCKHGDILITSLGGKLKYCRQYRGDENNYYDHEIEYIELDGKSISYPGTRTHSGHVYRNNRKPETDHDVIKIIRV